MIYAVSSLSIRQVSSEWKVFLAYILKSRLLLYQSIVCPKMQVKFCRLSIGDCTITSRFIDLKFVVKGQSVVYGKAICSVFLCTFFSNNPLAKPSVVSFNYQLFMHYLIAIS